MTWRVEPVRPHEVRVAQAELRARARSSSRRTRATIPPDAADASASAALFALWISAPASRSRTLMRWPRDERDPRLADLRGAARHRHGVVGLQMVERDDHRHQLRDARDRQRRVRVAAGEHLAVRRVDDVERLRIEVRDGRVRASGEGERDATATSSRRMRREGYFTRSFWPTWSEFELTPGLSACELARPSIARLGARSSRTCRRSARCRSCRRASSSRVVSSAVVGVARSVVGLVTGPRVVVVPACRRRRGRSGSGARRS